MKIKFEDIKIPPSSERQRYTSGKDTSKLEDSIYKLGQLHELTLDGNMVLKAGWRRYHAIKNLKKEYPRDKRFEFVKVDIRTDLSELEYFDIELEENWRRQNLTSYELGETLSKRKRLYEEAHPETKFGASIVKGKEKYQTKEQLVQARMAKSTNSAQSKKKILQSRKETSEAKVEPAVRYTKNTAEMLGVSESKIKQQIQVARAIEDKKVPEETAKQYKENKIPFSKILKEVQTINKKKKLGLELARKAIADKVDERPMEEIPIILEDDDEVISTAVLPTPKPTPKVVWCKGCKHGQVLPCPDCMGQLISCNVNNYTILKRKTSEGCSEHEE